MNPEAFFQSLEIEEDSITKAREIALHEHIGNVEFLHADLFDTPLDPESFDHVFVCFVLEHLSHPVKALKILQHLTMKALKMLQKRH